jgi:hypothetical protein
MLSFALHSSLISEPQAKHASNFKAPSIALNIISTCYVLGINVGLKALDRICDMSEPKLLECCAALQSIHALWCGFHSVAVCEYPALRSTMVEILERLATLELKELLSSEPEHTERF